eukprot:TRINITY_DN3908_c0_g1_i22.p1 TRINITY_DN3908_c0_g1~~TRINITY_DN3908_c0_g1_i22.p1  ORF type:complete len:185 (+),score=23.48 TRINITY_DN3908_c0_g1_i22:173-727(+)
MLAGKADKPERRQTRPVKESTIEDLGNVALSTLFRKTAEEVRDLGASTLTGKDKKLYETKRLIELGAKAPKNERMPLPMLQRMRAKHKKDREDQYQLDLAAGNSPRKRRADTALSSPFNSPLKRIREDRGLKTSIGSFKDGALRINKDDIARLNRSGPKDTGKDKGKVWKSKGARKKGKKKKRH